MDILFDLFDQIVAKLPQLLFMLTLIVGVMVSVAYLVYMERKVIAFMQLRHGPSVVGPFGLLQPIAGGML